MLCDNLEGWDGEGGEREAHKEGDTCITHGWLVLIYGRNQYNM